MHDPQLSRRSLLGLAGAGAGLAAAGALAGCSSSSGSKAVSAAGPATDSAAAARSAIVPFYGNPQAGILTDKQHRVLLAAFDVTSTDPDQLAAMLAKWSEAAATLTAGKTLETNVNPDAVPADTGETAGMTAGRLTLTLGYGPSLFDDRFGLASKKPKVFGPLPGFKGDEIDRDRSDGDLIIQACADDIQIAFHAVRALARLGSGVASLRWSDEGYAREPSVAADPASNSRNLFGFKDGSHNIASDDTDELEAQVWVESGDQPWLTGGTYLVYRKLEMMIEAWDRDTLADQELAIGRRRDTGAPLTGSKETDRPDFEATNASGDLVIPPDAHVRRAGPDHNGGMRMLRRGYSWSGPLDIRTSQLQGGSYVLGFMKDPKHFVTIMRSLSELDALAEYYKTTASGVYAIPPGIESGGHWGQELFG